MGYRKSFFRELSDLREYALELRDKEVARIYKEVHTFVLTGEYSSIKNAKKLVKLIDIGASEQVKAANLGISGDTVRVKTRDLSLRLYDLFGNDFFEMAKSGDIDKIRECKKRMYVALHNSRDSSDYILDEVKMQTGYSDRVVSVSSFDLDGCKSEISFLLRFSKLELLKELDDLNKSKLNYIASLLDGKGDRDERYKVMSILDSGGN